MHTALVLYVLAAMYSWLPPQHWQEHDYRAIAEASVSASNEDPDGAIELASLSSYESRFAIRAVGLLGETGPWQLLGRARGDLRPLRHATLTDDAREALRRWRYGMCMYTGEMRTAPNCPLAGHRYGRAVEWLALHPFVPPPAAAPVAWMSVTLPRDLVTSVLEAL